MARRQRVPLRHPYTPRLQPRPFTAVGKQHLCRFVEHRAQQGVTAFGYPAIIVGLAGLVALWGQANRRADLAAGPDGALAPKAVRAVTQTFAQDQTKDGVSRRLRLGLG